VTAFYDDSGGFDPGASNRFACFGMNVIPARYIHECGDAWWENLAGHFQYSNLQTIGIEARSSELYDMLNRIESGTPLKEKQQIMFDNGLNTSDKVNKLIKEILGFLAKPPVPIKYFAVVANKEEVWQEFRTTQINQWEIIAESGRKGREQKDKLDKLRNELSSFLVKHTYEFLLQRLQYLRADKDFEFSDAFVVGDESSSTKIMLETQAGIQAGLGKFSDLPNIVNRSWFGSSLHDPCLQMADWVAFVVRTWAEGDAVSSRRIKLLLPYFRGYPDPDKLIGRGIVLCPNKECFPSLPLKNKK